MDRNGKKDENESVLRLLSSALNKSMELSLQRKKEKKFLAAGFLLGLLTGIALSFLIRGIADFRNCETFRIEFKKSIDRVDKRIDTLVPLLSKAALPAGKRPDEGNYGTREEETPSGKGPVESATALEDKYQIFIHYHMGDQEDLAKGMKDVLGRSRDFQVWNVERVNLVIRRGEIRFFHREDRGGAEKVQETIRSFFMNNGKGESLPYPIKSFEGGYPNARKRLVEIWISSR